MKLENWESIIHLGQIDLHPAPTIPNDDNAVGEKKIRIYSSGRFA